MQPETSRTYRPVLIESEHTSNKCDLYKSGAIAPRQHFNFLAFLRRKESLSLAPSRSSASRLCLDIRDKLVCHSLDIFTIRLKHPGRSHQNPIGAIQEKKHTRSTGFEQREFKKHRAHKIVYDGLSAQEKIGFYLFLPSPPLFFA